VSNSDQKSEYITLVLVSVIYLHLHGGIHIVCYRSYRFPRNGHMSFRNFSLIEVDMITIHITIQLTLRAWPDHCPLPCSFVFYVLCYVCTLHCYILYCIAHCQLFDSYKFTCARFQSEQITNINSHFVLIGNLYWAFRKNEVPDNYCVLNL